MTNNVGVSINLTANVDDAYDAVEALGLVLVRAQKKQADAAKETRDAYGVLRDEQGRIVEGLTKWQRQLGYYVDEIGHVRTENGRFVEGLTIIQKKLGFEVDELGNIYNKAGKIVGQIDASAKQAELDSYLKKIARNTLTAADAFDKLKKGLDVFLGQGNALSEFVGKAGDVAHAITSLVQQREQYQQIKEQLKGLSKFAQVARAAVGAFANAGGGFKGLRAGLSSVKSSLKSVEAEAALASAQLALVGAAIAVVAFVYQKQVEKAMETVDPAIKGLDQYREKYEEIERAARAAGETINSLGDAIKFANGAGSEQANLTAFLNALKENQESGLSTEERAARGANSRLFFGWNPAAAMTLKGTGLEGKATDATVKVLDALGLDFLHAGKTGEKERQELYAGIASYVEKIKEQYGEEKKESDKIKADLDSLQLIIDALPEGDEQRAELEQLASRLRSRETEIIAAEQRAKAGVDKYLKSEDAAVVSIENYREKLDEWRGLIADGALTTEQFDEATGNLTSTLRDNLLGSLGIKLPAAADETAEAFNQLKNAADAGVLTSDEFDAATAQLTEKLKGALLSKLGVVLPSQVDATADALRQLADAAESGVLSSDEYAEAVRQIQEKNVAQLAASAGLSLEKETKTPSLAEFTKQLDEALADEKINAEQYGALLQAYRNNAEKVLQTQQDAAASALAASQGLDLDAVEKTRRAAMTLEEQRGEWEAALAEQKISQEAYNKAMGALNLAIDERTKSEQEATEKAAAEAREKALKETGIEALRQQAAALETSTISWREELEKTLENARKAFDAGTIGLEDLQQARKDYSAVLKAKTKEEKEAARSSVREALGVDSLMESLKSPAQKLSETLTQLQDALVDSHINSEEYNALRGKAFDEYRNALDGLREKSGEPTEKSERVAAGASLSDSRDFYKAVVNQMTPRSYEKKIEDTTARMAKTTDDAYRAQLEGNELLARIANAAPAFEVFG